MVGPLAAINSEMVSYPQDVIKTKIQVNPDGFYQRNKFINDGGFIDCFTKIYQQYGIKGFAVGMKPCLLRAIIADGLAIIVYEKCQ